MGNAGGVVSLFCSLGIENLSAIKEFPIFLIMEN